MNDHISRNELSSAQPDSKELSSTRKALDTISRQAAIDAINKSFERVFAWDGTSPLGDKVLENVPSAQPEQRWIPCSERLPEVYKDVLICWDFKGNREVLIGNMYSDGTFHGYDDEYLTHNGRKYRKAVAWMPLPEPWRGAE